MELITSSDSSLSEYDSLIYVGNYEGMPGSLKNLAKNEEGIYNKDVYLYRKSLNNYRKPVFLIVSNKGTSLMTAVKSVKE